MSAEDPPVREDGRCANCGKVRRPPTGKYATKAEFETDPFCSTECARAWHGTESAGVPYDSGIRRK
jgi:hypothetical protein